MNVSDPVCGKTIDLAGAVPAEHLGWAYFFCSDACRERFLAVPDRYVPLQGGPPPPPDGTPPPSASA